MLTFFLTALHVIVALILILVVLLQTGKRADLAGAFGGGGSQTAFGTRGAATVLSKITTGAAILFMLTSLSLSLVATQKNAERTGTVLEEVDAGAPPAETAPAETAPAVPVPTEPAAEETPGDDEAPPADSQP
jgi:preprotein translocase subunit SecG